MLYYVRFLLYHTVRSNLRHTDVLWGLQDPHCLQISLEKPQAATVAARKFNCMHTVNWNPCKLCRVASIIMISSYIFSFIYTHDMLTAKFLSSTTWLLDCTEVCQKGLPKREQHPGIERLQVPHLQSQVISYPTTSPVTDIVEHITENHCAEFVYIWPVSGGVDKLMKYVEFPVTTC